MEYGIGVKVFGDWEIVRELGEGSYGKVYELKKDNFGVTASSALKVLRIPKSQAEIREAISEGMDEKTVTAYFSDIVQHFVREIAVMAELKSHPNIVSCEDYQVISHPGTLGWDILIRMELLTSLQDYQYHHPMTEQDTQKMARDLCAALEYIQKKGLIHRDIKPGNVFVDPLGSFKLGDFGVARTAEKTMGGYSKQGTENYMAPEVYLGKPYGPRVDIYSLGMMLYRIMNGNRLPFYPPAPQPIGLSDRENALKKRMAGETLPPPRDSGPEFTRIILKACAHDPEDRYRTAAEMLEALRELDGEVEISSAIDQHPPVETDDPDADDATLGPGRNRGSIPSVGEEDATVGPFNRRPKHQKTDFSEQTEDDSTIGPGKGRNWGRIPQRDPEPKPDDRRKKVMAFWHRYLTELWAGSGNKNWKPYFAPDIPLQVCSNAIYNITGNEVRKNQILAILDCTPDLRIPCGGGVVITEDKMYIQLGQDITHAPKAVIEFAKLNGIWTKQQKYMFQKYDVLHWTYKDGRMFAYGGVTGMGNLFSGAQIIYHFVDYNRLVQLLNSQEWKEIWK